MTRLALLTIALLSACASPRAPENINSVPNVLLSLNEQRQSGEYIYVTGGPNDGASVGQFATFLVTPDDQVLCTFRTGADTGLSGFTGTVTGHRIVLSGIYRDLSAAILPNVTSVARGVLSNFEVEVRTPTGVTSSTTGRGDPRFDLMMQVFAAAPSPCWSFG